jgi:glycosyltransferase involved in cell wall biosynthesis
MRIQDASFVLESNGFVHAGPAYALEEFLVEQRCRRVVAIHHPLMPDDPGYHLVKTWNAGRLSDVRRYRVPSRPPYTYLLDPLFQPKLPRADCWVGFNPLAALRAIAARRLNRADAAVYWCIDFSRNRFGHTPATRLYEWAERVCAVHADLRVDITEVAAAARNERVGAGIAPVQVTGIGAWLDRVPVTDPDNLRKRTVVYLGYLVRSQGGLILLEALGILASRGVDFQADIVGRGPLEDELKQRARAVGVADRVSFHGYVHDERELEGIIAGGTVGLAPYDSGVDSFTRWADPGKLKSYLAAGLPILLTDVPPNARDLESLGAARIVPFDAGAIADALERLFASPDEWSRMRAAALEARLRFDWAVLLTEALARLGFRL